MLWRNGSQEVQGLTVAKPQQAPCLSCRLGSYGHQLPAAGQELSLLEALD